MRRAGQAEIDAAKRDGRWEAAYAPQGSATVPDDLCRALDGNPKAAAFFATLTGANRYAILYRINAVKRPETRTRKIADYVAMCERGEVLHQRSRSLSPQGRGLLRRSPEDGGKRGEGL